MSTVTTTMRDTIAVVLLNNPPVNMGNAIMRGDLARSLQHVADDPGVEGVVIASALPHFYAGSDITEFAGDLHEPQLPSVIEIIEQLGVPVVAALTGLAVGGGLELALGCDHRIGDPSTRVGFPEVTLGMVPGAGGTVRAPRLAGIPTTIEMVASARRLDSEEAVRVGLVDEIVPHDELVDRAVALAMSSRGKRRVIDRPVPPARQEDIDAAIAGVGRRARPNVRESIALVRRSGDGDVTEALAVERKTFNRLRTSDESSNLRYLFFAGRAAAKSLRTAAAPAPVRAVGIAGAGTMGASLAAAFAAHGFAVAVFDRNTAATAKLEERDSRITTVSEIAGLSHADIVIDAVFEDMSVKQDLLGQLEPVLRNDAIIVSNTSYLDLCEMSRVLLHRGRFAGLHFFNPPLRNPLVELIRTPETDDVTLATLARIVSDLGKVAIPAGLGDGFVANRVYADYRAQAEFLVEDGASPQEVDQAMVALGMPLGPFAVADMSGLDIAWARRKRLAATRDPRQRYVTAPDRLCEAGRLGQKTGAGWFAYPGGSRRGQPDPETDTIIAAERVKAGIEPRTVPESEIQDRILASMLCAAAHLVETGIAQRASDIDVALTEGFAFPKALGGPIRTMSVRSDDEIVTLLAAVHASCPVTFAVAEPATRGELPPSVARCLDAVRTG